MSAKKDKASATPAVGKKSRAAAAAGPDSNELNDEVVREYLKDHSDFLQRNPDLLDHLHVSHASGSAVSLVEKQVSVLRERNVDIRHRLKTLTTHARDNDKLFEQTRALVIKMLEADSVAGLYTAFMESMKGGFEVEFASMIMFSDEPADGDYRVDAAGGCQGPHRLTVQWPQGGLRGAAQGGIRLPVRAHRRRPSLPAGRLRRNHAADRWRAGGPDRSGQQRCRALHKHYGHPVSCPISPR